MAKEYVLLAHGQKDNAVKMKVKLTDKIDNETLTKDICNKGFSGNSSILTCLNISVFGQESSPESITAATLNRYQ